MGGHPRQPSLLFALENHAKRVGHVVDDKEEERGALHRIYSSRRYNDIRDSFALQFAQKESTTGKRPLGQATQTTLQ
jgi:hypothetical protein